MSTTFNRLTNCKNPYQGKAKKVLCVCSAGILRSPTAAVVLSQAPYNFNTRAAGIEADFALIPVDEVLVQWADEIVCMNYRHANILEARFKPSAKIITLNVEDIYEYMSPKLVEEIKRQYDIASKYEAVRNSG